jgi:chemotaxis protein CheX
VYVQSETIQQLDEAVAEVFEMMLGRRCLPDYTCTGDEPGHSASVTFSGTMRGKCAVSLDLETASLLTAELMGDGTEDLSADTVSELCNMIAGRWKSTLHNDHANCSLSTPTVTSAQPPSLHPQHENRLLRSYRFDNSCLILEINIEESLSK